MICTGVVCQQKTATFSFPRGLDVAAKEICQLCGGKMPVKKMGRKLYCSYECSMSVMKAAQAAARFVNVAVSRGYIPAAKHLVCVDCGAPAQAYDHRKYMHALNVDPVCRSCNAARGSAEDVTEYVLSYYRETDIHAFLARQKAKNIEFRKSTNKRI